MAPSRKKPWKLSSWRRKSNRLIWRRRWDSFAFSLCENYCSHQLLNWWQQPATGRLHLYCSNPTLLIKQEPPLRRLLFYGGDGGIRLHFARGKIKVRLRQAVGGNCPPDSCILIIRIPLFLKHKHHPDGWCLCLAETVGFEPTCRCRQTDFESAPL